MMNVIKNRQNDFNRNKNDLKIYIIHKKKSTSQIISLQISSYIKVPQYKIQQIPLS